jgi:hypothetical protein
MNGMIKGYTQLSRAYYSDSALQGRDYVEEIAFGMFNEEYDGGYSCRHGYCEVMMRWVQIGGKVVPKLEMFYDTFGNFHIFESLFAELSNWTDDFEPEEFCKLLDRFGFKDVTKTERG